METYQGVLRSPQPDLANKQFTAFVNSLPVLPFSLSTARRCAQLRETLQKAGRRVKHRALDLMTAAIALENDLTLVTRNVADYNDIPDLKLYRDV